MNLSQYIDKEILCRQGKPHNAPLQFLKTKAALKQRGLEICSSGGRILRAVQVACPLVYNECNQRYSAACLLDVGDRFWCRASERIKFPLVESGAGIFMPLDVLLDDVLHKIYKKTLPGSVF
jgi:hypothetical protein